MVSLPTLPTDPGVTATMFAFAVPFQGTIVFPEIWKYSSPLVFCRYWFFGTTIPGDPQLIPGQPAAAQSFPSPPRPVPAAPAPPPAPAPSHPRHLAPHHLTPRPSLA